MQEERKQLKIEFIIKREAKLKDFDNIQPVHKKNKSIFGRKFQRCGHVVLDKEISIAVRKASALYKKDRRMTPHFEGLWVRHSHEGPEHQDRKSRTVIHKNSYH